MAAVSEVKVLHDEHRMSLYTTTFTLAKESLGTTILFMPYAFVGGGWLATGLLIFFSGAITWGTYRLQLDVLDSREEL
jgi:amino acid permease